jgi:hypothetical protein
MGPSLQMDLSATFRSVATGNIVHLNTLKIDKRFPITYAQRHGTQYGPTDLLTLRVEAHNNVKVFMPKRYAEVFRDTDLETINGGNEHYHLLYRGTCSRTHSYILRLEK